MNNLGAIWEFKNMGDVLLFSLVAILLVFAILALIVLIAWLFSKGIHQYEIKTNILPKEQNKLLEEDQDAVVAALVATIEFHNEIKKDARLLRIEKIDEE